MSAPEEHGSPGLEPGQVAVVIVNWRAAELTVACVRSLRGQGARIIVVDNGSFDGSTEVFAREIPGVEVVETGDNRGFAAGANAGIRACEEPVVILLNNDARARGGFVRELAQPLLEAIERGEKLAATTGRVFLAGKFVPAKPGDTGALQDAEGRAWVRLSAQTGSREHGDGGEGAKTGEVRGEGVRLLNSTGNEVDSSGNGYDRSWLEPDTGQRAQAEVFGINGGCCALRRDALEQVGLLREDFFMYYEDTELSYRLRAGGWHIRHVHEAVTDHLHAASSGTHSRMFIQCNARNRLLVATGYASAFTAGLAYGRTLVRALRGPGRAAVFAALGQAVVRAPGEVKRRLNRRRSASNEGENR